MCQRQLRCAVPFSTSAQACVGTCATHVSTRDRHTGAPVIVAQSASADWRARSARHSRVVVQVGQFAGRGDTLQHSMNRAQMASNTATHVSVAVAVTHASALASLIDAGAGPHATSERARATREIGAVLNFIHRLYRREVTRG